MSAAAAPVAPGPRSSAPLQRMPFGRYKGLPFAQVPEDYVAWLLKREIDDRLRAALNGSANAARETAPASSVNGTRSPAGPGEIGRLAAEFLEARRQAMDARRRIEGLRARLIPFLEANKGYWIDSASRQKISIFDQPRWEYDPTALHRLVEDGSLTEEQFAACLRTVADKKIVASWVERGTISREQLVAADARSVTGSVRMVRVRPLDRAA